MYAMLGTGAMTGIINDYQSSSTTQTIWVFSCNATLDPPSFYIQEIVVDKDIVIPSTATETTFLQWCTNNVQKLINGARHIKCNNKVFTDLSSQGLTRPYWSLSINYIMANSSSFSTGILIPDNSSKSYNFLLDLYNTTKKVVITQNASANDPRFLQGYKNTPSKIDSTDDHSTFLSWLADNIANLRTGEDGCGFIRCRNKQFNDIVKDYWYIDYGYVTSTVFYGTLHDNNRKLYTIVAINLTTNPSMVVEPIATTALSTTSSAGLMSATDKTKLDGIATNANNYVHPTTSGYKHIPSGGNQNDILINQGDGTAMWTESVPFIGQRLEEQPFQAVTNMLINSQAIIITDTEPEILENGQICFVYE
jgi:hypothetical protein